MADLADDLFECFWGDIKLLASRIEWEAGNTLVKHELAAGDVHPVSPRGGRLQVATAELLFDDFPGATETGMSAFRRFRDTTKERRVFVHPVDGAFFARIESFRPQLTPDCVSATCEFVPDEVVQPVAPISSGSGAAGENSVAQAAADHETKASVAGVGFPTRVLVKMDFTKAIDVNISLSFGVNVGISLGANVGASVGASGSASASGDVSASVAASVTASAQAAATASAFAFAGVYARAIAIAKVSAVADASGSASAEAFAYSYAAAAVTADARATVAAWQQDEDLNTRQVLIDTARLSQSLSDLIDVGGLEDDLDLYPVYQAVILLGESIRDAALAATSSVPQVFVMRRKKPTSTIALAAHIYGGADAQLRAQQIELLNQIATPGWMQPGDYVMPALPPGSSPQFLDS